MANRLYKGWMNYARDYMTLNDFNDNAATCIILGFMCRLSRSQWPPMDAVVRWYEPSLNGNLYRQSYNSDDPASS